jgi:hypothetical protein
MTDDEIIQIVLEHCEGLFPKVCSNCDRFFETLREYILNTKRLGTIICHDAEIGDWEPKRPIGAAAYSNCPCGNTLALTSKGMPISQLHLVLRWVKKETGRRGLSPSELMDYVRDEIRKRVMIDPV